MYYYTLFLLFILLLNNKITANITGKQYASMPELFHQDNYDRCMLLEDKHLYCSITHVLEPVNKKHPPEIWNTIKNVSHKIQNYRHDHLRHKICVPLTCPEVPIMDENDPLLRKSIEDCYNKKFEYLELRGTISKIECETLNPKYPVDWLDIVSCTIFVAYISFVFYGTFYEEMAKHKNPKEYKQPESTLLEKILSAVSLNKNWNRLITIKTTAETEKLKSIQGIRFYNTILVLLCHTILFSIATPMANTRYTETMHENPLRVLFSSGPLCVTTFFFISSFLLCNGLFEYMKNKKGLSLKLCVVAFLSRMCRLTPTLAVVILFNATWLRHLGNGPLWNQFVLMEYRNCRKNWWTNLLYVNNWYDFHNMCLPVTWYLGLDTQYFAMALLFIWFLKVYEKYIWLILGAALSINMLGTFLQNYYYDFTALVMANPELYYGLDQMLSSHQFHYQHGGFIGNMAGPIGGIAFGYYFYKHKNDKPEEGLFTTKLRLILWWLLTFVFGFGFVISTGLIILRENVEHDAFWASTYVAISRPVMVFAIGTGILGSTEGIGWLALRIVRWPPMYILGRLSLSAYLVHMSILLAKTSLVRSPHYISDFSMVTTFFSDLITVYITALLVTLFVELPGTALQKFIFNIKEENDDKDVKGVEKNK